jgi:peptidoglycan biosynthesis protein MviN/MurJ (putative lipid II flippase)
MFRLEFSKSTIRKIIKISCIFQFINAFMDFFLWITIGYHVPSWALATLVAGYSVLLLSYDKLVS